MRLSSRLLTNAAANYARMGISFLFSVFFVWYAIGKVGVAGLGMIAFASASTGVAGGLWHAMRASLMREMAAAIVSGDPARVSRSLTSALVLCLPAALLLGLVSLALAALSWLGVFRTPEGLSDALAIMLLTEGAATCVSILAAPYTQALFAGQHLVLDNLLVCLTRMSSAVAAVLVFGLGPAGMGVARGLIAFGVARAILQILIEAFGVGLAKSRVEGLVMRRSAFDRSESRAILGTVWHTGQVVLLMSLNVQLVAILINLFFGMTYNGVWQIVVQLGGYTRMLAEGLLRGIEPLSTLLFETGKHGAVVALMVRSVRYQLGTLLPVTAFLAIFMHPVLVLWVGGRIALDTGLAAAGITTSRAISIIAIMTYVHLVSQVVRGSAYGIERVLYGIGQVRSYSWFAKYAAAMNVALAAALMWLVGDPIVAPVSILATYVVFYWIVVPLAAVRRGNLPLGRALSRSIPRPLLATALLCLPLLLVRFTVTTLSLAGLAGLLGGTALLYAVLLYAVILERDEGSRIAHILRTRSLKPGAREVTK
jgi:hypothetical protein